MAWDANTVYDAANWVTAGAYALLAAYLSVHAWARRSSRLTRYLVWPLCLFFASGVVTTVLTIYDGWPATHRLAWAMALRAVLTLVPVAPLLYLGVKGLVLLPTKEEYDRVLAELRAALAAKDAAAARAADLSGQNLFLLEREVSRLRLVGREAALLRERVVQLEHKVVTRADVEAIRAQLHRINNAAS